MRQINALSRVLLHALMTDRANDADNRVPRLVILRWSKTNALSERALVGPILTRQSLVDDSHVRRAFRVRVVEISACEQRYTHRAKVTRRNDGVLNYRRLSDGKNGMAFDRQTASPVIAA